VLGRLFKSGNLSLIQNITAHLIARLLGGALEAVSECPTLSENLAHAGDFQKREPVRFVLIDLPISVVYVALSLNWLVWLAQLRCATFPDAFAPSAVIISLWRKDRSSGLIPARSRIGLFLTGLPNAAGHPGGIWSSRPPIAFTRLDGLPGIVKLRRHLYLIQDLS
jgi:hypothetical protein